MRGFSQDVSVFSRLLPVLHMQTYLVDSKIVPGPPCSAPSELQPEEHALRL
jgi:hypothetical protein